MPLKLNDYLHYQKIKKKKLNGHLKSSLRKKEPNISYTNMLNSEYMFCEYLNLKEHEEIKYKPTILIIQIILNIFLLGITYYLLSIDSVSELAFILFITFLNLSVIWIYSFLSIIKSKFKRKNNKLLWLMLIIFLPFSALFYPDFRKIQIIID